MDPVTTVGLIVALIGAAERITPQVAYAIGQWAGNAELTVEQLAQIDAALRADRTAVAEVYEANGVR